jgi:hypothetical protein
VLIHYKKEINVENRIDLEKFVRIAEAVTQTFISLPENPKQDRTGGYIVVIRKDNQKILILCELGVCLPDKIESGMFLCQEKAKRLQQNKDHHSSWQSRDVAGRKYGGAVTSLSSEFIGGMSGFVEHGDEAIVMVTWHLMGWLSLDEANQIARFSENPMFNPLLEKCKDLIYYDKHGE